MRLGHNQLRILIMLGSPTMSLVVPGRDCRSLIKNGLLKEKEPGAFAMITAKGLRALADAMDAGKIKQTLERMKRDVTWVGRGAARMFSENFMRDFFGLRPAAPKRARWEYREVRRGNLDLAKMGADGWELCGSYDDHRGEYPDRLTFIFKRQR